MANKTIYELTENQTLDAADCFEQDVYQSNERKSLRTTLGAIANKIITGLNFIGLNTTDKTVQGAINELKTNAVSKFSGLSDVDIDDETLTDGQIAKWNATSEKWENADESGSGHEILNDGGTALAQEDTLQFKGAYAHDDSQNNKTVVEVVREMTRQQYEALSDAEKKGIIQINDEIDADNVYTNGVFIDTGNVIKSATDFTGSLSYTATEDCAFCLYLVTQANVSAQVKIDGVTIIDYWKSSMDTPSFPPILLKKGQVLSVVNANSQYNSTYRVYGLQQGSTAIPWVELTGTLTAGSTSITFSDIAITANSVIDYYTDTFGVEPTAITLSTGSVVLTFEAQQSDLGVKVRIS